MPPLARALVLLGLVLVVLGLALWLVPGAAWLGRLPGDLRIERPNLRVYVPITTSILVSVVLSALFWVVSRLR
jgi:ribose/xylose/arabinose/galactoside ABC-type transport system permease subunit